MPTTDAEFPSGADPFARRRRPRVWRELAPATAAVAVGGAIGAAARYGIELHWPIGAGGFPWATFAVNVTGCALMGLLMVVVTELRAGHRLLRPLLGTGVLGGYTTFSTFVAEAGGLAGGGRPVLALLYLVATPATALLATWTAAGAARRLLLGRTP